MTEVKNSLMRYNYRETAEYQHHVEVIERLRQLSLEEKLQTLVDAGILTEALELAAAYGGDAPDRAEAAQPTAR
jgi:hypothetical protein